MKKLNKKGFTLAELLIVIAIIAILIAIAIPVFGGQLENARLQTDHANIRSAYALAQVANLNGGVVDDTGAIDTSTSKSWTFCKDGSITSTTSPSNAYKCLTDGDDSGAKTKCASSAGCLSSHFAHTVNAELVIIYDSTDGWVLANAAPAAGGH